MNAWVAKTRARSSRMKLSEASQEKMLDVPHPQTRNKHEEEQPNIAFAKNLTLNLWFLGGSLVAGERVLLEEGHALSRHGKSVRHYSPYTPHFTLPKINTTLIKSIAIDVLIIIY
jgi:hypothetical protein